MAGQKAKMHRCLSGQKEYLDLGCQLSLVQLPVACAAPAGQPGVAASLPGAAAWHPPPPPRFLGSRATLPVCPQPWWG